MFFVLACYMIIQNTPHSYMACFQNIQYLHINAAKKLVWKCSQHEKRP